MSLNPVNSVQMPYFGTFQNITFAELEAQRKKETNTFEPLKLKMLEPTLSPDINLISSSEHTKPKNDRVNDVLSKTKSLSDLADYCAQLSEDMNPNEHIEKQEELVLNSFSERRNVNNYRPVVFPLPNYPLQTGQYVDSNLTNDESNKANGTSCHHCKVRRSDLDLAFCTKLHPQKTKSTKRRCQKKFCFHCLKRCYNEDITTMGHILSWVCPVCCNTCSCSGCRSKRHKPRKRKKTMKIELNYDNSNNGSNHHNTSSSDICETDNSRIDMVSKFDLISSPKNGKLNNNNSKQEEDFDDTILTPPTIPSVSPSPPIITPSTLPHNINALSDLLSSPIGPNIVETLRSLGISLPVDCDPTTIEGGQQVAFAMASAVMLLAQVANNGRVLNTSNSGKIKLTALPPVTTPVPSTVISPNSIETENITVGNDSKSISVNTLLSDKISFLSSYYPSSNEYSKQILANDTTQTNFNTSNNITSNTASDNETTKQTTNSEPSISST